LPVAFEHVLSMRRFEQLKLGVNLNELRPVDHVLGRFGDVELGP
jgi:hypothetical protein